MHLRAHPQPERRSNVRPMIERSAEWQMGKPCRQQTKRFGPPLEWGGTSARQCGEMGEDCSLIPGLFPRPSLHRVPMEANRQRGF
ncbi:Uncharacterized protein HZ326_22104 [Fusarium oxysporum f. sp. albedinis]|nr:Uncharacterized protein HZ326_22104 [Fusarium oxysporum f. sp. albedinis]